MRKSMDVMVDSHCKPGHFARATAILVFVCAEASAARDDPQTRARLSWLLPTVRVTVTFSADWHRGAKAASRPGLTVFPPGDVTAEGDDEEPWPPLPVDEETGEVLEEIPPDNGRRWQRGHNVSVGLWWQLDEWLNGQRGHTARQLHKKRLATRLHAGHERLALANATGTCRATPMSKQLDCLARRAAAKSLLQRRQTFDAKKGLEGSGL
ncbi:MAG: hypothetical protein AAF471_03660 [Myxococcota bacterium]